MGAVVGFIIFATWDRPSWIHPSTGAFIGLVYGTPLGAVLFPLAGWLLMRRVALGGALLGTAVGTTAGGLVGWLLPYRDYLMLGDTITRVLVGGVVGFLIAVLVLRRSAVASDISAATSSGSVA